MKDESQKKKPQHEEDVDQEIFDALEQMEIGSDSSLEDDQLSSAETIELRSGR